MTDFQLARKSGFPYTTVQRHLHGIDWEVVILKNAHVIKRDLILNKLNNWDKHVFEGKV